MRDFKVIEGLVNELVQESETPVYISYERFDILRTAVWDYTDGRINLSYTCTADSTLKVAVGMDTGYDRYPAVARTLARSLEDVSVVAEKINRDKFVLDTKEDPMDVASGSNYRDNIEQIMEWLRMRDVDMIIQWFEEGMHHVIWEGVM